MWYVTYLIFIGLAVLFLLISLWKENNLFWNVTGSFISSIFWLIISLGQLEIEFPYTKLNSADTIISGSWVFTDSLSPYFTYLFFGIFVVLQVYVWVMVFDFWYTSQMVKVDD